MQSSDIHKKGPWLVKEKKKPRVVEISARWRSSGKTTTPNDSMMPRAVAMWTRYAMQTISGQCRECACVRVFVFVS